MKQVYINKEDCCGCTACKSVCPKNAIIMGSDDCDFSYPEIVQDKCINCGLCKKVCSFTKPNDFPGFEKSYVVRHLSKDIVNDSRSGGFFTALSDVILDAGGSVYGAILDEKLYVKHLRAVNKEQRNLQRKSKYAQSDLGSVFSLIENDLILGKYILFTGTGCQCDGLKEFLKTKKIAADKLVTCDLVCHGATSPGLFKKYIAYQSKKHHSHVAEFYFRDKGKYPWFTHVEKIIFSNQKIIYTDVYANLFYTDARRPSCYKCKYASLHRVGDISIGDCWGGQIKYPDIVNEKGASLVLVNSEKGREFFEKASRTLEIRDIDINDVMQPRLTGSDIKSSTYDFFWKDYQNMPFDNFMKKYSINTYSWWKVCGRKINSLTMFPFRKVKKILHYVKARL